MLKSVQHIAHYMNKVAANATLSRLVMSVLCALFGTVLYTSATLAQVVTGGTLYINGSFVNAGTISVNNHIKNNTSGSVSVLPGSTTSNVLLTGAANANGHTIYGGGSISFYRLDLRGGRETRLKVNVEVTNRLQVGYTGNTFTATDSGFTIENNTLTVDSLAMYLGTSNLIFAGGTVAYTCSNYSTPPVPTINKTTGIRYGTLNFTGSATKSMSAATTGPDSAATLTQTGGQLSILGNFDITGTGSFANLGAITASKKLRLTTTVTSCSVTSMNNSSTGTFENASTAGTLTFTGAAANSGTITNTSTGTITFANNLTGTGTISQTAGGTINVGGTFTQNTYSLNSTNGTVVYNNTTAQSVIGTSYYNLTISSAADTTIANYKTAAGAITLSGNIAVNSGNTLDMQGYGITTPGGGSSNSGKIKWSTDNAYVGGSGVTEFYGSTAGNIATGSNYGTLLFTGTGMKTFGTSPITATGNMSLLSGSQITINNGVTLQINGVFNLNGTITNNGIVNLGP